MTREPAPPPSSHRLSPPSPQELSQLMWRDLGGRGRAIARFRVALLLGLSAFVSLLLLMQADAWRIILFGGAVVAVSTILVAEYAWMKRPRLRPAHIPYLLGPVVVLHTAVIIITGGAESPFLVLYVVVGMMPAVIIGRVKPFLVFATIPLALLWILTIGAATELFPVFTPSFLGGGHAHGNPWFAYTQAGAFTVGMLLGGSGILTIRAVVERSAYTAATIRQELFDMMRERNRELINLSGELAHELKNPLASIQGLSTLVERKLEPGSKSKEQMGVLVAEVKRMSTRLDEFLNFSRPVVGLSSRSVLPAQLLAEVVQLHEGLAEQRDIALTVHGDGPGPITCDPRKVKQVLVNLLQNALEATPHGGTIEIRSAAGPADRVRFVIEDSGPGIAEEIRQSLFQPGATTKRGGSGLGLTIARSIAEQHGGSLGLEDRAEGGCRAVLELPTEPSPPAARADAASSPASLTVGDAEESEQP